MLPSSTSALVVCRSRRTERSASARKTKGGLAGPPFSFVRWGAGRAATSPASARAEEAGGWKRYQASIWQSLGPLVHAVLEFRLGSAGQDKPDRFGLNAAAACHFDQFSLPFARVLCKGARLHAGHLARRAVAIVAQLVRAPVCGTGGRGFEPHRSPHFCFALGQWQLGKIFYFALAAKGRSCQSVARFYLALGPCTALPILLVFCASRAS